MVSSTVLVRVSGSTDRPNCLQVCRMRTRYGHLASLRVGHWRRKCAVVSLQSGQVFDLSSPASLVDASGNLFTSS